MSLTAFVFPGQGSQSVGMLDSFAHLEVVKEILERADETLKYDLSGLIARGPSEELNLTVNTQPALLTAGYAVWRVWRTMGGAAPAYMAGHSLGEYTALVCSGAMLFEDALQLVRFRAQEMQAAAPAGSGGMAAILGLDDEAVRAICAEACDCGTVEAVNFNTPGQVVIAGTNEALAKAVALAKERGAKRALPLKVSGPFHSSLMQGAAKRLGEVLERMEIFVPQVPVLHNVDASEHRDRAEMRRVLAAQTASPVLWADTIREFERLGVTEIAECGPGTALSGMVRRITKNITAVSLNNLSAVEAAIRAQEEKKNE